MPSSCRGCCVIICNEKFEKTSMLKNIQNGRRIFKRWRSKKRKSGWRLIVHSNLTAAKIMEILIGIAQGVELKHRKEFELMIVSHGGYCDETEKNVIFGIDAQPLFVEDIVKVFNDDNCSHLRGKRRAFNFQLCCSPPKNLLQKGVIKYMSLRGNGQIPVNNNSDALIKDTVIIWSTVRGAPSYRRTDDGALFITALCDILQSYCNDAKDLDVLQCLEYLQEKIDAMKKETGVTQITEIKSFGFLRRLQFQQHNTKHMIEGDSDLLSYPFGGTGGYCLIINNYAFGLRRDRRGSLCDVKKLEDIFQRLGFCVVSEQDLIAVDIIKRVEQWSQHKRQAFVLIIMSHGFTSKKTGEHVIRTGDETVVELQQILDLLKEGNCPQLKGKPKLLVFNTCRVESNCEGISIAHKPQSVESDGIPRITNELSKSVRDTFLLWSTLDGYHCLRKNLKLFWLLIATTAILPPSIRCTFLDYFRFLDQFLNASNIKQYMELNLIGISKVLVVPPNPERENYKSSYTWLAEEVGICLIVNIFHSKLRGGESKQGYTRNDIDHLSNILHDFLKFNVRTKNNINREQLLKELECIRQDPQLKRHNAFILYFISSSRREKEIDYIELDQGEVSVEELKSYFSDYNCPRLRGKPKIFCFECSRGDRILVDDESTNLSNIIKFYFDEKVLQTSGLNNAVISMNTPIATYVIANCYDIKLASLYNLKKSRREHQKNRSSFASKDNSDIRDLSRNLHLDLKPYDFKHIHLRDYMDQILFLALIANNWELFDESDDKPNLIIKCDSKCHVFHLLKERVTRLSCFCSLYE